MASQPARFYEFGPFRVDAARGRLVRDGAPIPLQPKAFDLLLMLVRHAKRPMSKAELMAALWPDTFVDDANLTQHVFTLRKALGEGAEAYIETVPRRGYCFAADVREAADAEPAQEAPRPVASLTVDGERKQVTVLHCGVSNAAALADRLGPSGLHQVMTRLADIAAGEIARFEGLLRQPHADELVALFGARIVHEDDARRATLAALGIERRLQSELEAGPSGEERPIVRIGINTGPAVVSRRADERGIEYSAVGETVRVAQVLEQLADPGAILISDTTRRAVEGIVDVSPTPIAAGGICAFRVVGRATAAAGTRPPGFSRTWAPFVGRRSELALLGDLASRVRGGKGHVVSVVGEPGMGKSRLVHEFAQAMAACGPVRVLEGRCVSYGSLVPYLPLAGLVRMHCGVSETDAPETIRGGLERASADADLQSGAAAWLIRAIGLADSEPAPETLSPEAIKARTFDALRVMFLNASTRTPLLLIVEDVHWIDRTSGEFLATLIERVVAARVMLVVTCRPGFRAPWIDHSYAAQITLSPLTAVESAEMVGSVARGRKLAEGVSAAILAKAEGNPFFLEELARAAAEHNAETPGIPDTVHGVIMARLDRLPGVAKQLLQTASVLGREVPLRLLERVWRGGDFSQELAELCRLEFLYERPGSEEPVFVFTHALTQDVAYDSLLARRRGDLHLEAARALEGLYADRLDDITTTLAYHYARTDLADEAVTWLMRAADQAARVYANAEAILHLDLARRRLERLPEGAVRDRRTVDAALQQAHSLYFLGRFRESVEVLLPHEARVARLSDPALTAACSFWLAHMYSRLGDARRAGDQARRAIAAATRAGDQATLGKAHGLLALEGHWSGHTGEGVPHGAEAVRLLREQAGQQWWLGMAHFYLALNHLLTGRFDVALAEAGRADAAGREIGDPRLQCYASFMKGWIDASRGDGEAAIAACRLSLEQAPDRVSRAYASLFLAFALLEHGDHAEALERLEPTFDELEGFAFPQWQALSAILIGEAQRLAGRLGEARRATERGAEIAGRAQYAYAMGLADRIAGRIALDDGRLVEASAGLERSLEVFTRIGATYEQARTRLDIARAARCAGDTRRATAETAAALAVFETLDTDVYRTRARASIES